MPIAGSSSLSIKFSVVKPASRRTAAAMVLRAKTTGRPRQFLFGKARRMREAGREKNVGPLAGLDALAQQAGRAEPRLGGHARDRRKAETSDGST